MIADCTMDYDSLRKAGSSVGTGAMIVMDETTCMVRVLERISRFYMAESCGQCTPCREGTGWLTRMLRRILAGQGKLSDLESAGPGREPDRGTHDLRARRRGGLAGAELPEAFPPRVRLHGRTRRQEHRGSARAGGRHERRRHRQRGGRRPAAEGAQGRDDHPAHRRSGRLRAALLLPREALDRGQLPHVPGRGREGAEADAGLRDARGRGHEGLHPLAARASPRRRRRWSSC